MTTSLRLHSLDGSGSVLADTELDLLDLHTMVEEDEGALFNGTLPVAGLDEPVNCLIDEAAAMVYVAPGVVTQLMPRDPEPAEVEDAAEDPVAEADDDQPELVAAEDWILTHLDPLYLYDMRGGDEGVAGATWIGATNRQVEDDDNWTIDVTLVNKSSGDVLPGAPHHLSIMRADGTFYVYLDGSQFGDVRAALADQEDEEPQPDEVEQDEPAPQEPDARAWPTQADFTAAVVQLTNMPTVYVDGVARNDIQFDWGIVGDWQVFEDGRFGWTVSVLARVVIQDIETGYISCPNVSLVRVEGIWQVSMPAASSIMLDSQAAAV